MSVDVVMVVKNGSPHLRECLNSLYANVPVNKLIVVDGGSEDGTLSIVRRYSRTLILNDDGGTRATARQKGIESVETDWFMFLDSDVILSPNWFARVSPYMSIPSIGAVQGVDLPLCDEVQIFNRSVSRIWKNTQPFNLGLPVVKGIFTGDTLIRREAVAGIRIPPYLHVYEDRYIRSYIEKRGYKWVVAPEAACIHYTRRKSLDAYYLGFIDTSLNNDGMKGSLPHLLKNAAVCLPGMLVNPRVTAKCLKLLLWNLVGSLKAISTKPVLDKGLSSDIAGY
ncbi:glycosyltransferase family 2 protein [Candidatus Hecatella orcuttiae]|jgi:glycosyltransferase involved in cell wall biosynthesis|uniref:glycosyltransferase family 2 protein n=1 Tax=Candidatus Hecatella orcuttiae TaxID=1935119 RepID=UPI002867C1C1|nr:glycosyltransferase family 2 protein [Candidatus Hecatella orcuttiae]